MYEKRKKGAQTRVDFLRSVIQRLTEALLTSGFAAGGSFAGAAAGAAVGTLICPGVGTAIGTFIGSIVGGALAGAGGRLLGSFIGNMVGTAITSVIKKDDKAVENIKDLKGGDQIVLYQWLLHPRCHMIVIRHDGIDKILVIRSTYQRGIVKEWVKFVQPVYRIIYNEEDCCSANEAIKRALSKLRTECRSCEYNLLTNNCKDFANWCKRPIPSQPAITLSWR